MQLLLSARRYLPFLARYDRLPRAFLPRHELVFLINNDQKTPINSVSTIYILFVYHAIMQCNVDNDAMYISRCNVDKHYIMMQGISYNDAMYISNDKHGIILIVNYYD